MKKSFCVAITGGIGCGKSTAAIFFKSFGVNVINADLIARELTQKDSIKRQLTEIFGSNIFDCKNNLNRKKVKSIIFNEAIKKRKLEQLLHPLIRNEIKAQINQSQSPYCLIEIPLLNSREHFSYVDRVLCITTTKEKQLRSVMKRDLLSKNEVERIMVQQISQEERDKISDDFIFNTRDLGYLKKQCEKIHQYYLSLSS
jgi:dephospho-CoA kinase